MGAFLQTDIANSTLDSNGPLTPLLKWPGGKRAILKFILPLLPTGFNRYFEPFLGGGALFFALHPERAVLSDNNGELINCYIQVRDNPDQILAVLSAMPNTSEDYYRIRRESPCGETERAARLIYLSMLSFNGIHRVNLEGQFNVPYGRRTQINPCNADGILNASAVLSRAQLSVEDFEVAVADARKGDLVYLDPPYTVAHGTNGFVKYNARIFSWADQTRLAMIAADLARRGCHVVVSNADHPSVRSLYEHFRVETIYRASRISASSRFRREVSECVFHNGS